MRKRAAIVAAIVAAMSVFPVTAASASCTEVIEETGCVENVACAATTAVVGDKVHCTY